MEWRVHPIDPRAGETCGNFFQSGAIRPKCSMSPGRLKLRVVHGAADESLIEMPPLFQNPGLKGKL